MRLQICNFNVHRGCVSEQLRFGEMRSYAQWEYCVEESPRQHSLQKWVHKEISFTGLWRFIWGKQLMSLIQYAVLTVTVGRGKWKRSLQYYISLLNFKFTREIFWSLISKFTIFSACPWDMINTWINTWK